MSDLTSLRNLCTAVIYEAFQGVLAIGDIAPKCGDNLFLNHRQQTINFEFRQSDIFSLSFFDSDITSQRDSFVTFCVISDHFSRYKQRPAKTRKNHKPLFDTQQCHAVSFSLPFVVQRLACSHARELCRVTLLGQRSPASHIVKVIASCVGAFYSLGRVTVSGL